MQLKTILEISIYRHLALYRHAAIVKTHELRELSNLEIKYLKLNYQLSDGITLMEKHLSCFHYSPGVKVVPWKYEKMDELED
ncbi:hypothetical protein [Chryseobacterium taklimakanense]|nr:hypothetical protein [Chryseobacterium taklimakanense]